MCTEGKSFVVMVLRVPVIIFPLPIGYYNVSVQSRTQPASWLITAFSISGSNPRAPQERLRLIFVTLWHVFFDSDDLTT